MIKTYTVTGRIWYYDDLDAKRSYDVHDLEITSDANEKAKQEMAITKWLETQAPAGTTKSDVIAWGNFKSSEVDTAAKYGAVQVGLF